MNQEYRNKFLNLISYKKYNDKRKFISSVGNTIQKIEGRNNMKLK